MNLHFFFEGKVAREEVASAFLATILEQRADIRGAFFDTLVDCIGSELAESFRSKSWTVQVEEHQIDIRLESKIGDWVILLENKLQAGSMQQGQLPRYYYEQITREPATRVVAVYLAPGAGMGGSEVAAVKFSDRFRRDLDFAARVSWDTLTEFLRGLSTADGEGQFIGSGIDSITEAIERAATEKFPNEGGREQVHAIACEVRAGLQQRFPGVRLGAPWPAKDRFTLASHGTNLTLWLRLVFETKPDLPHVPVNLFEGDKMHLTAQSMLKLSGAASRIPELKVRWRELNVSGGQVIQEILHRHPRAPKDRRASEDLRIDLHDGLQLCHVAYPTRKHRWCRD
jgi:PD-(D/E)XK nuclease superfamily protein